MGPYGGWDLIGIIGMKHLALVFAATSIWLTGEAWAAMTGPEKATELLARAWMIDNRCNVLDRDARDELTGFVARAEISLAEKASVKAAKAAVAKGRATGTSAPCGEQSAKFVHNVLVAAKSASGVADMDDDTAAAKIAPTPLPIEKPAEAPETQVTALRLGELHLKSKPKVARLIIKPEKPKAVQINVVTSAGYAATAEAYYRELRCRTLSQRSVNAMYAKVLREHRRAVTANGKVAVRRLLREAEARASGRAC